MAAETGAKTKVTEAVAVFHDVSSLDAAVDDLRQAGFRRSDISLLASEDAIEQKLGHRYERVEELEDVPVKWRLLACSSAAFSNNLPIPPPCSSGSTVSMPRYNSLPWFSR